MMNDVLSNRLEYFHRIVSNCFCHNEYQRKLEYAYFFLNLNEQFLIVIICNSLSERNF